MADITDYRKQAYENNSSNGSQDYYQLARDQEYTQLLDKEIQLENAKSNAMKYASNQTANSGLATTGYGSNQNASIYNSYMNALGTAQSNYGTNMATINATEAQARGDRAESVTTMMQSASTEDQLNSLMKSYGYMDGNNNILEEKPEGMNDDDWNMVKYYYNIQKDTVATEDTSTNGLGSKITDFGGSETAYYYDKDGTLKNKSVGSVFYNEGQKLSQLKAIGELNTGNYVQLINGWNDSLYLYYGTDGTMRIVSQSKFNKDTKDGTTNCYKINGNGLVYEEAEKEN